MTLHTLTHTHTHTRTPTHSHANTYTDTHTHIAYLVEEVDCLVCLARLRKHADGSRVRDDVWHMAVVAEVVEQPQRIPRAAREALDLIDGGAVVHQVRCDTLRWCVACGVWRVVSCVSCVLGRT